MDLLRWRRGPRGDQPQSDGNALPSRINHYRLLTRAVDAGFLCLTAFATDVYLEPLRTMAGWQSLLASVQTRRGRVMNEFARAGGRALLGLT